MKILRKKLIIILIFPLLFSCSKKKKGKNIDSFYTQNYYLEYPSVPLSNPVFAYYIKEYNDWSFKIPNYFKNKLHIENLNKIGIERTFIYGKLEEKKWTVNRYKTGDYVYARRYGGTLISKEPFQSKDEIRIYPIDSINKKFILPERWFVIKVADSTTEAFFSKKKYENYLTEKGISGKMYDINKYHKQYKETGIVPWFPDSVKVKLKRGT